MVFANPQPPAAGLAYYIPPVYMEVPIPPLPVPPMPVPPVPIVVPSLQMEAIPQVPTVFPTVQGRIPHIFPNPPICEEAIRINRAMLPGSTLRRNALLEQSSHCDLIYYQSPDQTTWRCLKCYTDIRSDGEFRYLHVAGLTTSLKSPDCPGPCHSNPFRVTRASSCRLCTFIIQQHKEEVRKGEIFLSCPIR